MPLEQERAAKNALFADVLMRGTEKHKGLLQLQKELSALYGADIDTYVGTSGEAHVITVFAKLLKDKYTLGGEEITRGGADLFREVLTEPQLENGVGMIASMKEEFSAALEAEEGDGRERSLSIATGHAAYGFISECAERVMAKFPNIRINVYEIRNDFFGESVTVAGLVTGVDLIAQLTGKELYGKLKTEE